MVLYEALKPCVMQLERESRREMIVEMVFTKDAVFFFLDRHYMYVRPHKYLEFDST